MDTARFHALVASLEELARRDPDALRRRIKAAIGLGYAYVLAILALVVGLIVALVLLALESRRSAGLWKLILALGVLVFVILRALWVKLDHPQGERLTQRDAPKLFERVEAIRKALKAPKPDVVILNAEFNASVTQVPRFGIFGGDRTYLMLGLPLMYALGPRHLDAVLGHEFGHLSGSHPKYGLWAYRVFEVWGRLLGQLQHSGSAYRHLFEWFFKWYVPRLHALAIVRRRDDEFAADLDGARTTSPKIAGQALASIEVRASAYSGYWQTIQARIESEPEAPARTWTRLPEFIKELEGDSRRSQWLAEALSRENLVDDSHPALRHRLQALKALPDPGADPHSLLADLVPPLTASAASYYLGPVAADRLVAWEREWRSANAAPWKAAHAEARKTREVVGALVARHAAGGQLTPVELWTVAQGLERLDGDEAALPWLERTIAADSSHPGAHFVLGRILLERHDAAGTPLVKKAMQLEPGAIPAGNELLRRFHAAVGDREAAFRTDVEADAHFERHHAVAAERNELTRKDTLSPPTLTLKERKAIENAAKGKGIGAIWVARKVTKHHAGRQLLVILVEPRHKLRTAFGAARTHMTQYVLDNLQFDDKDFIVLQWDENATWVMKKMRATTPLKVTAAGARSVPRPKWHQTNRRALVFAGIGLVVVGLAAGYRFLPRSYSNRIEDPTGVFADSDRGGWDRWIANVRGQTGIDYHVVLDSFPAGTDLAAVAASTAEVRGIGGEEDFGTLLLVLDLNGGGHILSTPGLEPPIPDELGRRILAAHEAGMRGKAPLQASVINTMIHVARTMQVRALGLWSMRDGRHLMRDSIRFALASGDTLAFAASEILRYGEKADPRLDTLLGPAPTAEAALQRYLQWMALPVYVPKARLFTGASRSFYDKEFELSPAFWEYLRDGYLGTRMIVETRGQLAVAYAVDDPLVSPLFFRKGAGGWEMDTMAELLNSQNIAGGSLTWYLARRGGDHDEAFADRMVLVDGLYRFRDGANEELPWRGPVG